MKAAVAREMGMSSEERLAQIESDMGHTRSTLVRLEDKLSSEIQAVRSEIQAVRGEVKEVRGEVQELREDLHFFKTDTAKEFGVVRAEIERLRTAIESTKVWFLASSFGAVLSGIGALVGLRALKLF